MSAATRHFVIAMCVWMVAGNVALGELLDDRDWILMTSDNFRVHSVLGEKRTAKLLRHLEVMHSTFGTTDNTSTYDSKIPTVILIVDDHDDYAAIGAPANSMGYFISDLRENAILVEDSNDTRGAEVMLHEYVHFLSFQSDRIRYPRWYEEGRAEYLSTSRLRDNVLEVGLPVERRLASLRFGSWLPLGTVLELTDLSTLDEEQSDLFYGQSWLLVHYLSSQPDAELKLPASTRKYSVLIGQGVNRSDAFEQAFDQDIAELEPTLLKYFVDGSFASREIPADTALPGFAPRARPLSVAEVRLALARMALRFRNLDGAEAWFNAVLSDPEFRAHGETGLGRIRGIRGDIEGARSHFDEAIYLMAWDFDIWMDYAQYWAQRVSVTADFKTRKRYAMRLVEALESALTIKEATPELNSLMGFAYLAMDKDIYEAIDYLEAAADEAPFDQASRLLLANAYLFVGDNSRAIGMAESVLSLEHEPSNVTVAAQALISKARDAD